MRIMYCILSGHEKRDRLQACVDTWALKKNVLVFSDENRGCSIKCSDESGYAYCPQKVRYGMQYVKRMLVMYGRIDWLFFCDDDTYVNVPRLEEYLSHKDENRTVYGNRISLYKKDPKLKYLSGGSGYAMKPETLELIVQKLKKVKHTTFADVMVGYAIKKARLKLVDDGVFHMDGPWDYNYTIEEAGQKVTFHHLEPNQMRMAHRLIHEGD